jgi:acyl dehydratase
MGARIWALLRRGLCTIIPHCGKCPVFIGDTIAVTVTVKEKKDSQKLPDHGIVVELCQVTTQRGETVLACEHLLVVKRRAR